MRLKCASRGSLKYRTQTIEILAPSHKFVGLYLRSWGMYRQSEKNLLNIDTSSTCPHNMVNGWDLLASLGHPCKFQRLSRLGSVTARHSSSGHQPNFAALNRGRHLYSAGRPSHWALAHVLFCVWLTLEILDHRRQHSGALPCMYSLEFDEAYFRPNCKTKTQ